MKAISNKNVIDAQFKVAQFTGAWLASFGRPELRGSWLIYGESGSGKTHFALELLKYISHHVDRVAYNTLEQGLSLSFQNSWKETNMQDIGSKVIVLAKEPIDELRVRLMKRKSPNVIVIDSITAMMSFTRSMYMGLINDFPDKLFIFIAHEKNHNPYPAIAEHVRKLSDVKIHVEGYKAYITTRYKGAKGEGGADYTIWERGSQEYELRSSF
ncbi:MAG: ATP-binding protein [Muribaculaceae bacterium]